MSNSIQPIVDIGLDATTTAFLSSHGVIEVIGAYELLLRLHHQSDQQLLPQDDLEKAVSLLQRQLPISYSPEYKPDHPPLGALPPQNSSEDG